MNSNNKFTKIAITQQLVLGQIAKELLEINQEIERDNSRKMAVPKVISTKILNLFIKSLA